MTKVSSFPPSPWLREFAASGPSVSELKRAVKRDLGERGLPPGASLVFAYDRSQTPPVLVVEDGVPKVEAVRLLTPNSDSQRMARSLEEVAILLRSFSGEGLESPEPPFGESDSVAARAALSPNPDTGPLTSISSNTSTEPPMQSTRTLAPRRPRRRSSLGNQVVQHPTESNGELLLDNPPSHSLEGSEREERTSEENGIFMATAVEPLAADPFSSGILPEEPPDLVQKDDAFGAELYSEGDFEVSARPAPRLVSRRTPDQDGNAPKKTRRPRGSKALSQEPVGNLADRLADAGERFLERLATVIAEVTELREANRALLAENARLTSRLTVKAKPRARIPRPRGRRPQMATLNGKKMGHRATPSEVTGTVVMAVISKLEKPTAGEIAAEITKAGVKVSGRAIRFIAEKAGAKTFRGADGKQHYVISH